MSERDNLPPINPFSQTAAAAEMVRASHLAGKEQGRSEALALKNRLSPSSSPTTGFRAFWDRVTGRTAAREQGRNETMLHILEENDHARQEGFQAGQLDGVRLAAATAAHTINNAISSIQGGADMLGLDPAIKHNPQLLRYLRFITEGVGTATQRVADLSSIRRIVLDESNPNIPMLNMVESTKPDEPQP